MRRLFIVLAAVLVAGGLTTGALAVSVHWKHGSPQFTDLGLKLNETGIVAGVGNGDLLVQLSATGNPTADCVNPGSGEHRPPGQQPAEVTLTGAQAIPNNQIKNGNASYTVTTNAPTSPVTGAPGCPNAKWIENITDVAFTTASLTIRQDTNGSSDPADPSTYEIVVFGGSAAKCTFSPATSDGPVTSFTCG